MKEYVVPLTLSEIQVSYRPQKAHRPSVTCSRDAFEALKTCYNPDTFAYVEHFVCLYLNRASRIIGYHVVSKGGVTGTVVDAKVVLGVGIKCCATSIILSHQHPSGNLQPSQQDIDLTKKLVRGAEVLDMKVVDHLILGMDDNYFSFADENLI